LLFSFSRYPSEAFVVISGIVIPFSMARCLISRGILGASHPVAILLYFYMLSALSLRLFRKGKMDEKAKSSSKILYSKGPARKG
jgi:hypothetical protein